MKNHIYIFICSFMTVFSFTANAQYQTDKKLENKLRVLLSSFHGTAGVYVRNLKTGKEAAINADTVFPTASIVKVPILVGVFKKIDEGLYTYHQPLIYRDSIARGGSGLMQFFKDSTPTELRTLVSLMLSHSDNTAAVWCEKLAGGGVEINSWLEKNGFKYTRKCAYARARKNE